MWLTETSHDALRLRPDHEGASFGHETCSWITTRECVQVACQTTMGVLALRVHIRPVSSSEPKVSA